MAGWRCGPISNRVAALLISVLLLFAPGGAGRARAAPPRAVLTLGRIELTGGRGVEVRPWLAVRGLVAGASVDTLEFEDLASGLEAAFLAEGFLDARVRLRWSVVERAPADSTRGGNRVLDLTVVIAAGRPWTLGLVRHAGADSAVGALLARALPPRPGDPYRTKRVEAEVQRWLDAYDAAGFAYARLRPVRVAADSGRVDITFRHEPGPRVILTGLDLEGARVTRPTTAERLLGFRPGQTFRSDELRRGLERLRTSGFFSQVGEAELVPEPDPSRARLRIPVREAPSGTLAGLVGYSGQDRRFAGQLDFRLRSIAGTGRQLRARWSGQTRGTTLYQLSYREPALLGRPLDGAIELEHLLFDTLYVRTRLEAGLVWRPRGGWELEGVLGTDRAVITAGVNRAYRSLRWRGALRYDRRDAVLAPTRGYRLAIEVERGRTLAGTFGDEVAGASAPLTRVLLDGRLLWPLAGRQGLALTLLGRSLRTDVAPVPQYELYPLGGAVSLRGYREEQFFSPAFLLGQLEYRVGVTPGGGGAYLFVDGAGLTDAEAPARNWPRLERAKVGYGAGVRVASRLGRVGVDYGLATGEGPLDGRIHLRLETEF